MKKIPLIEEAHTDTALIFALISALFLPSSSHTYLSQRILEGPVGLLVQALHARPLDAFYQVHLHDSTRQVKPGEDGTAYV